MKTAIEHISKTKKKISFEVSPETVNAAYRTAFKEIGKTAKIPGFRNGKIPEDVLVKFYKPQIDLESLNIVVEESYTQALKEHDLVPLLKPDFKVEKPIEKGEAYSFAVEVEVKPEIKIDSYKGIVVKKREIKIDPKDVEAELNQVREARAQLKPAPEGIAVSKGMMATIDFEGFVDGKAFDGGKAADYQLEIGKGTFIKGFEEQIVGMKVGDDRDINVTFPEEYGEETLKGKPALFKIKLKAIHEKELPPIDDELAKDIGKETLAELQKEISDHLTKLKENENKNEYSKEIIEHLLKNVKVEVPEAYVAHEASHSPNRPKDEIEKSIKTRFILEDIAKKEAVQVAPQELEMRFQHLSQMYRQPASMIKKYYVENNLVGSLLSQLAMEKTLDFIVDQATLK